jgi:hypothetical protein
MKSKVEIRLRRFTGLAKNAWPWLVLKTSGAFALVWFLVRVIPKPSRASYPCQRAAFPLASSFVIWLCGLLVLKTCGKYCSRGRLMTGRSILVFTAAALWTVIAFTGNGAAQNAAAKKPSDWNFIPAPPNQPVGVARGIFPGRVVWARDPLATKWAGHWQQKSDQWWLDENTDQARVDHLLASTLTKLTGKTNGADAWRAIFEFYNLHSRQLESRGYQPGEIVAVKVNLNNSTKPGKVDNYIDATPQTILAMVRQLVNEAKVRPQDIVIYDVRRYIPPYILSKVWGDFPDVRFVQQSAPVEPQPKNPKSGDYHNLEKVNWVEGITYSRDNEKYKDARLIPKQIKDATYLVNLAILKAHSYPYNEMDRGDSGQTGISMCGKNHFGSIKGPYELHSVINPDLEATPHFYSPLVDLASSPNLGAKTILYVLDGLYCGRKWQSYPQHFPNPPFNNRVEPYENPDWPASLLASLDGVALDSVGLDLIFAQTKNNADTNGHPRILIRAYADDYLFEMAQAEHPPSGTVYQQGGRTVASLGVHEHWDSDATKQYSRNLDLKNGQGIELVYLPPEGLPSPSVHKVASPTAAPPAAPAVLPGRGLAEHDFLYAGESKQVRAFIVRGGKIVWTYTHPGRGEISDAILEPNGNLLIAHQFGVSEVNPDQQVIWTHDAPTNTEIHTAIPLDSSRVGFVQNGNPAKFVVINKATGAVERDFVLPVKNPKKTHLQFRHARLTPAGTLLVAHMDLGKAVEYDLNGKELWSLDAPGIWSATPLTNGNVLVVSQNKLVRELNRAGETVWEWTVADAPDYRFTNLQLASRLPNGNTIINNWFNQWGSKLDTNNLPVQAIEVTPDKKIVWALRAWLPPEDLGPATTIQILDRSAKTP